MLSGSCELPCIFSGRLSEHTQTVSHKAHSCVALTEITHAASVTGPLIGCQVTTYMHDKHVLVDTVRVCFQALCVVCRNASLIWQHMTQWVWETVLRNLNDDARSQEIQSVRDISQEQRGICLLNESRLEVSMHLTSGSPLREPLYSVWNQILA